MRKILKLLIFKPLISLLVTLMLIQSCAFKTKNYTYYETIDVPYTDYEEKMVRKKVPVEKEVEVYKYEIVKPFFINRGRKIKIAVLPFTDSNNGKLGTEVAAEIEYELIKRIEKWQSLSQEQLKQELFRKIENNELPGISKRDVSVWFNKNKRPKYEVVSRTELEMILKEANISSENYMKKLRRHITGIDGLIVGHVRSINSSEISMIVKVVDVRTSKIIYIQKYVGSMESCINNAVDAFYYNIKLTNKKIKIKKTVYEEKEVPEKVPVTKYRKEEVKKTGQYEDIDWGKTLAYWIIAIILISAISSGDDEESSSSDYNY